MTRQEQIKKMSMYRPSFNWEWEKDPEKRYEIFLKDINGMSPDEYNEREFFGWCTYWEYEKNIETWNKDLEAWSQISGKKMEGDQEELVRIQVGTSKARAEAFIREGQGYVITEDIMGDPSWNAYDRWLGLQVSILNYGHRSSIARLRYYAECQASRFDDIAVVLTALVPRKYIYCQKNGGEFCISRRDFDKLQSPEIMTPTEYENNYLLSSL